MRSALVLLLAGLLAVALYVANVSWWMDSEVLDTDAFVDTAVVVLNQPASRDAMAAIVVERLVEEIPLLMLVDDALADVLSAVLGTDSLQGVQVLVSEELHQRMVGGETGPIVVDLEPYRDVLLSPIEAISPELAALVPDSWFSSVEVLEGGAIPDLSAIAENARAFAIGAAIAAVVLIVAIVTLARRWAVRFGAVGGAFLIGGGLAALAVPAGAETISAVYAGAPREVLIVNLYEALTQPLTERSLVILAIGLILIGVALASWAISGLSAKAALSQQ